MIESSLQRYMKELLALVSLDFKRYMYDKIEWDLRLVGLVGPRGVGKSTIIIFTIAIGVISCNNPQYNNYKDISNWENISDTSSFDGYILFDNKVYGGFCERKYIKEILPHLENSDRQSFMICLGSKYAKDIHQVYYPIESTCFDGEDFWGCYFTKYIIKGADPNSFKYIGYGFAMDKKHIYRYGRKISLQEFEDIIKQKQYNFHR